MNLLAQNKPRQRLPGRVVGLLTDAPDQSAPYLAHYYLANRAKLLVYAREYLENYREQINARRRARYAKNKSRILEKARREYRDNKRIRDAAKARANARYARIKGRNPVPTLPKNGESNAGR